MYQPSLNYDYQKANPIRVDHGQQSNNQNQQVTGQQTQKFQSMQSPTSNGAAQLKYASPFEETKKINLNQSQQRNLSPQNFVYQQTTSKQNESYQSPQFIKTQPPLLASNLSASNSILNKNMTNDIMNSNQIKSPQQNIIVKQNTFSQDIQQQNQQQIIQSQPIIQQSQPQLVSYSYQPAAVNYVNQNIPINTIPSTQSFIQHVQLPVPNQQVIIQTPAPPVASYQTNNLLSTTQVQYIPQRTNYLIESKPIIQNSQIRMLSPSPANRVQTQTNEEDFSKPLFSNKSPYSKRYEEQQINRWQDDSKLYRIEQNRQQQYYYNEQNDLRRIKRSISSENYFQSSFRFQDQRSRFEGKQSFHPQHQYSQSIYQDPTPPAFDYTNYSNQYEPAQKTANFKNYREAPYSVLASKKVIINDDIDFQTKKIVESRLIEQDRLGYNRPLNQSGLQRQFQNQPIYQSNQFGQNKIDSFNIRQSYQFLNQDRDVIQSRVRLNTAHPQEMQKIYFNEEVLKERDLTYMFEKRPVDLVKEYIQAILDLEREIESNRIKIVRQQDYSVQLFYEIFDANESGYIIVEEFVQGLKKLGIQADQNDVRLLVNRYSLEKNNKLDQQEFINMVVPKTYTHIESIFVRKPYISEKNMREDTRELMAKIMKSLLNSEIVLEQIRQKIQQKQIAISHLYQSLCQGQEDSINKQNLRQFLVKIGVFANREEIPQIMQRFDLRDMGFFRLQEFEAELKPRFS